MSIEYPQLTKLSTLLVGEYDRYIPSSFNNSLTFLEKLESVIKFMNETGTLVNSVVDLVELAVKEQDLDIVELQNEYNNFEQNVKDVIMPSNIRLILDEMVDNGTLASIINVEVMNMKADITYVDDLIDGINTNKADVITVNESLAELDAEKAELVDFNKAKNKQSNLFYDIDVDYDHLKVPSVDGFDWTNAIQTALNDAVTNKVKEVRLNANTYYHTGLNIPTGVQLVGKGRTRTILINTDTVNHSIQAVGAGNVYPENWAIKGMKITTKVKTDGQAGIYTYIARDYMIADVEITNHYYGVRQKGSWRQHLQNVLCVANTYNFYYAYNESNIASSPMNHINCHALSGSYGVYLEGSVEQFSWNGGDINSNTVMGLYVERSSVKSVSFRDINFEHNSLVMQLGKVGSAETPSSMSFENCRFFARDQTPLAIKLVRCNNIGFHNCSWNKYDVAFEYIAGAFFSLVVTNPSVNAVTTFANLGATTIVGYPFILAGNASYLYYIDTSGKMNKMVGDTLTIGGGTPINKFEKIVASVDIGIVGAYNANTRSVTIAGLTSSDMVEVTVDYLPSPLMYSAYVTTGKVDIRVANPSGASVDSGAARNWRLLVKKM